MTVKVSTMNEADRCELCGASSDGTFKGRIAHLRGSHPAYTRGLLLRVAAPPAFLLLVVILSLLHAPTQAFVVALAATFGMLFFGKIKSRTERARAGARRTLDLRRMVKEGALPFLLFPVIVALLILVLSRQ